MKWLQIAVAILAAVALIPVWFNLGNEGREADLPLEDQEWDTIEFPEDHGKRR